MSREGWKETKVKIGAKLDKDLRKIAVHRGWTIDTCARKAMKRAARRAKIALPGGGAAEVLRRSPETLLATSVGKRGIWIGFPDTWIDGLASLVSESELHESMASLWRSALINWVRAQEIQITKEAATAKREAAA